MASVLAVQGISQRFTSLPMTSSLVRAKSITEDDLAVAWTYELIRGLLLSALIVILAPVVAEFMKQPDITGPLQIASLGFLLGGIRCPRIVELRREARFGTLGFLDSSAPIAYAVSVVLILLVERSYWALVYAGLISKFVNIALGYILLPWNPRVLLSWVLARPMVMFCGVLLGNTISLAFRENGMVFLLGFMGFEDQLGYYNRAVTFSLALTLQAAIVFWRVAFPVMARYRHEGGDPYRVARRFRTFAFFAGIPLAGIAVACGDSLIPFVLGDVWNPMIPLWNWLVVGSVVLMANAPLEAVLQATHREKQGMMVSFVVTGLQILVGWVLLPYYGLVAIGMGVLVGATIGQLILQWFVSGKRIEVGDPASC